MAVRLTDPARRKAIPDYNLAKIVTALEKTTRDEVAETAPEERDIVQVIMESGVPAEKKRELISAELTKIYERRQTLLDAVKVLDQERANDPILLP